MSKEVDGVLPVPKLTPCLPYVIVHESVSPVHEILPVIITQQDESLLLS